MLAPARAFDARRRAATTIVHRMTNLRIATLNCLNLALPGRAFYEGVAPYTPDEYIAKTQWLATMIDRLAADFVLVQEVFHEQALNDVIRQCGGGAKVWRCAVPLAQQTNALPRVGLVWRASWTPALETIVDFPDGCAVDVPELGPHRAFSRPLLRARIAATGKAGTVPITLLNVHLKSRRPDYLAAESRADLRAEARAQLRSLIKRGAEAAALRQLVIEATCDRGAPLIVAGDFNDQANAVTTRMVADTSWRREDQSLRECMLFDALEARWHAMPGGGRDVAYTILHAGEPERIDQIFVSEHFIELPGQQPVGTLHDALILNDHIHERLRPEPRGLERIYSDHAAVCLTIALR